MEDRVKLGKKDLVLVATSRILVDKNRKSERTETVKHGFNGRFVKKALVGASTYCAT